MQARSQSRGRICALGNLCFRRHGPAGMRSWLGTLPVASVRTPPRMWLRRRVGRCSGKEPARACSSPRGSAHVARSGTGTCLDRRIFQTGCGSAVAF